MTLTQNATGLAAELGDFRKEVLEAGYPELAQKIEDVAGRVQSGLSEIYVSFCGLFSAGKSSLINALTKDARLATGAVPTTAEVFAVEFSTPSGKLVLLDTPGVDSTDAAHQAATEAALHKADIVVFVMDYQHVESEENMELARTFIDRGKTLYLVVNQVDKHAPWELSFDEFRSRVEHTFLEYGIDYEKIYYTSTKSADVNDIAALSDELERLAREGSSIVRDSILRTIESLADEFVKAKFEEDVHAAEEGLYETIGFLPFDETEATDWIRERSDLVAQKQAEVQNKQQGLRTELDALAEELRKLVDLAQISPYETTEKGRQYVESLRPNFKVGLFGAKQKTLAEQDRRLTAFVTDLSDRTEKFLVWPLQSRVRDWIDHTTWAPDSWRADVNAISVSVAPQVCTNTVNSGAVMSDQYPYQYVKDVVAKIKGNALSSVRGLLDAWSAHVNQICEQLEQQFEDDVHPVTREQKATETWLSLVQAQRQELDQILNPIRTAYLKM